MPKAKVRLLLCFIACISSHLSAVPIFTSDTTSAFSYPNNDLTFWASWPNSKGSSDFYQGHLAQDKAAFIWKHMLNSKYAELPKIVGPGFWGVLRLFNPFANTLAITHEGDFMIPNRQKDIHSYGTAAMVRFDAEQKDNPYSGIFSSGSRFGVVRFSLAGPSNPHVSTPGLGLKFFVDNAPSLDLVAMYSLDGQESHNLFANEFSTAVRNPKGFMVKLLGWDFNLGMWLMGKGGNDGKVLSLKHIAENAPYKLIFKPTKEVQELLANASNETDFRVLLEGKGINVHLYDVYGVTKPKGARTLIGRLTTTSDFVASSFGDEILFFKHNDFHEKVVTQKDDL